MEIYRDGLGYWTYNPDAWNVYEVAGITMLALAIVTLCIAGWLALEK